MARISDQIREIALLVCDRLAEYEAAAAPGLPLSLLIDQVADSDLELLLRDASAVRSEFDAIIAAGAGIVAKRSERELGYSGLAQRSGHRTPVAMVQSLTGSTRVEAARQVRLGEVMGEADAATQHAIEPHSGSGSLQIDGVDGDADALGPEAAFAREIPWYEPLTRAVRDHRLKSEAVNAILRGLGEPTEHCGPDALRAAAEEVLEDAAGSNIDELGRRARRIRDRIDPVGVALRFTERYEQRKWRFGRNENGVRTAWIEFDDESAAWIDAIVGSAMRPRRGGPRFVDPAEADQAQKLLDDPRSNDQLIFDLLMDTLRAGAQADPSTIFGSRQPGVRVVITQEQLTSSSPDGARGTGFLEETGAAVPLSFIDKQVCDAGTVSILTDTAGTPLDVGREQRLFTSKQRIALAIRDGGCEFPGCDRPPSFCEAHHIDGWAADGGRTDLADGMLLCRHHHMLLHNNGWRITREGSVYWMIPPRTVDPAQAAIRLKSKSALRLAYPSAPRERSGRERQQSG